MLSLENLPILIVVLTLLWNSFTLIEFVVLLYYKFRHLSFTIINTDELDTHTLEVIKPLEDFLLSEGFEFHTIMEHDNPIVGNTQKHHIAYYYNSSNSVHAVIKTQPFRGALEAAKISYNTLYESKNVCTTVNGEKHTIPGVPKHIYLFDHYLPASQKRIYDNHLKDRKIENEIISKETFSRSDIMAHETYEEQSYVDTWKNSGLAKTTSYGYRFVPSLALWKFSAEASKGYRKFSKILKDEETKKTKHDKQSQANGILSQLKDMEKPRGNSRKLLWLAISLTAFIALFSLFGLSIVDIAILVLVLLVHELGHYLAMRYFGYTDTSIFFLPFGAATVGRKEQRNAFEEYIVFLAGPLPGIVIGAAIFIANFMYPNTFWNEHLQMYAIMSLIINYLNLLPIFPLDGGRILQTLLLLRYPKGQFYFYIISLAILTAAMIWMQDPILLIIVVALGFGMKQNYRISQLLQNLLKRDHKGGIDKTDIVNTLIEDDSYSKETLSSKANIAKNALLIFQTSKPGKILVVFGLIFYLLPLLPLSYPLMLAYGDYYGMDNSEFSKLSPETQKELTSFYADVESYKGLTENAIENYSIEDSMNILENYFNTKLNTKALNRTIGKPLENIISADELGCEPPDDLVKLYHWHNGITDFFPYENFFSFDQMKQNHILLVDEEKKYNADYTSNYVIFINSLNAPGYGLAYHCKKEGIYQYDMYEYQNDYPKIFYSYNHMLKVTAEAYKAGIYHYGYDGFDINQAGLSNLRREYISDLDKQRYKKLITYLQKKALEYQNSSHDYLKTALLVTISKIYDPQMTASINLYTNDKNKKIRELAVESLGTSGDKTTIPLLLAHLDDAPEHCHGAALSGLSYLVDKSDVEILNQVHQSATHNKKQIRKNAYAVIGKIASISSLPILKQAFKNEEYDCKLTIVEAFGRIGSREALPLLEHYLSEINKMDFSIESAFDRRDYIPHPSTLKKAVEKAIKIIKKMSMRGFCLNNRKNALKKKLCLNSSSAQVMPSYLKPEHFFFIP